MPRLLFALLFSALIPLCAAIDNPVPLESGKISGLPGVNADVRVFKGIPYAASPVGNLRWRAPSPAPHWDGVRTADKFSAACMQTEYPEGSLYRTAALTMSEDCLYLNVWTAAKLASERRPVMLWIHGGGLTRGMGTNVAYDGEELANQGVVLVTINYRLGVFGYFSHPELTRESDRNASGAYGFLDQIAALQWVRQNIVAFGGDPARMTIFGESAGAWSVNALVSSPLAKGLFSRAIAESGGNFGTLQTLADAEKAGARLGSLRDLRAMSAQELLRKGPALAPKVVDGWFLPQDIYTTFATGKQNDVPMLLGSNADEGTAFTPLDVTLEAFRARAKQQFGDRADEFLKIYSASNDKEAWKEQCASLRDQMFGWQNANLGADADQNRQIESVSLLLQPSAAGTGEGALRNVPCV